MTPARVKLKAKFTRATRPGDSGRIPADYIGLVTPASNPQVTFPLHAPKGDAPRPGLTAR